VLAPAGLASPLRWRLRGPSSTSEAAYDCETDTPSPHADDSDVMLHDVQRLLKTFLLFLRKKAKRLLP
ncbi:MAG: hypothetical protein IKX71_04760, partial [Bacteroidales bacterium]|nr:hypothetical protein [Bacteroidales bacterium]